MGHWWDKYQAGYPLDPWWKAFLRETRDILVTFLAVPALILALALVYSCIGKAL